jgi:hypothetical protein
MTAGLLTREKVEMSDDEQEKTVVFAVGDPDDTVNGPMYVIGMSQAAWDYCKDGSTHMIDLRPFGMAVRISIFGGPSRDEVSKMLMEGIAAGKTGGDDGGEKTQN